MNYDLSLPCAGFGSARLEPRRQLKHENGPQLSTGTWRLTLCPGSLEITLEHRMSRTVPSHTSSFSHTDSKFSGLEQAAAVYGLMHVQRL